MAIEVISRSSNVLFIRWKPLIMTQVPGQYRVNAFMMISEKNDKSINDTYNNIYQ